MRIECGILARQNSDEEAQKAQEADMVRQYELDNWTSSTESQINNNSGNINTNNKRGNADAK